MSSFDAANDRLTSSEAAACSGSAGPNIIEWWQVDGHPGEGGEEANTKVWGGYLGLGADVCIDEAHSFILKTPAGWCKVVAYAADNPNYDAITGPLPRPKKPFLKAGNC